MAVNWGIQKFQPNTKLDLSPLRSQLNFNRQQKRQDTLADLTLSRAEKEAKKESELKGIWQQAQGNPELVIPELLKVGYAKEAQQLESAVMQKQQFQMKQKTQTGLELSNMSDAVLSSKNPVDAFMVAREDALKRGLPMSQGLQNYFPTDEEIADGRLDPRVATELDYISKKAVRPKGPMSIEEKMLLMKERYKEKKNLAQTKSDVKVQQPLTAAEKSRERIAGQKVGIAEKTLGLKQADLGLKQAQESRDSELFEQKRVDLARKNKAYSKKNRAGLDSIQTFLDRAGSVLKSKDLGKTSGLSRYLPGGSEVPIFATKGKDLQGDIDFLVSLGVVETMTKLKSESPTGSTGFGALSENELKIMQNAFSLLGNPDLSVAKKRSELNKVIEIMERRAREQRELDRGSNELLGPEKTEEELLNDDLEDLF